MIVLDAPFNSMAKKKRKKIARKAEKYLRENDEEELIFPVGKYRAKLQKEPLDSFVTAFVVLDR